ncbi:hypothetical protein [Wolbachia endosymbiont (group A) of Icerya purchasi]|uniref:hypothetical protein n=1 Tax=Wolbachia endosymbiont (group A) of Icerya purchasi TaxID=2954019 RepID=UPI002230C107|nr:hypothetical protein [Wolbachia endosymbiont (group A) of Icerya purchasi]
MLDTGMTPLGTTVIKEPVSVTWMTEEGAGMTRRGHCRLGWEPVSSYLHDTIIKCHTLG